MLIFTKIAEIQGFSLKLKDQGKSLGFVPTMGALHKGHLSLIKASKNSCDFTICSIFVNPTQFNDKKDLERYPRMPEEDALKLENAGCDVLFVPSVKEIYPNDEQGSFDFGPLGDVLEGKHRPGHFNGVAQVVKRLFEIVTPNVAFFGSKDYQQVLIVKKLARAMGSAIKIIACPILREPDGLAMSSRNMLLSPQERASAGLIPPIMHEAAKIASQKGIDQAKSFITNEVSKIPAMRLEYYEICDPDSLEIFSGPIKDKKCISLFAVFVGKIRLIDNLPIN